MNYRIIHVTYTFSLKKALDQLTREVNEAISMGWEPAGGVGMWGTNLTQAMVRRR